MCLPSTHSSDCSLPAETAAALCVGRAGITLGFKEDDPRLKKGEHAISEESASGWAIKMFEPKMLQSNAAHLVQKVSENAVHRLDLHHGAKEKKAVRTSKVMMGPRYERPMRSRPEPKEVSPEDKDAAQQLEDAERLVRPTSCRPDPDTFAVPGTCRSDPRKALCLDLCSGSSTSLVVLKGVLLLSGPGSEVDGR